MNNTLIMNVLFQIQYFKQPIPSIYLGAFAATYLDSVNKNYLVLFISMFWCLFSLAICFNESSCSIFCPYLLKWF